MEGQILLFITGMFFGMMILFWFTKFMARRIVEKHGYDFDELVGKKKKDDKKKVDVVKAVDVPSGELSKRIKTITEDEARLIRELEAFNMSIKQWWRDVEVVLDKRDMVMSYNRETNKIEIVKNND